METPVDTGTGLDENENRLTCPSPAPGWYELLIFKRPPQPHSQPHPPPHPYRSINGNAATPRWTHLQVTTLPISNHAYRRDFKNLEIPRGLLGLKSLPAEALAQLERVLREKNYLLRRAGWAWVVDWVDVEKEVGSGGVGGYGLGGGEFCLGVRRVRVHDMGDEWEEDVGRWADVRGIEERGSAMLCT
ncbi:unnamed protein product [Tuber aestivum]|uniref:Uncharacterized protein n=1 Tax=Tuber aestivum TaxID=59557 RepID=A0A292PK57_9PEZI|nr:unnamed protein product [Tuber aestivum]